MVRISITKTINLGFLGEEYVDSWLKFKAVPVREYDNLLAKLEKVQDSPQKSLGFMKDLLRDRFIGGSVLGEAGKKEEVTADDLDEFPGELFAIAFEEIIGRRKDPN